MFINLDNPDYPNIRRYKQEDGGRLFVATDVHGHWSEFYAILARLDLDPEKDLMIIGGDGVDRGPESIRALDAISKFEYITGNHESNIMFYRHGAMVRWGEEMDWFYDLPEDMRMEIANLFYALPLAVEVDMSNGKRVRICHNFSAKYSTWRQWCVDSQRFMTNYEDLMFDRSRPKLRVHNFIPDADLIINGHTPFTEPTKLGNVLFIDTGAGKSGHVTIAEIDHVVKFHRLDGTPDYYYSDEK